MLYGNVLTGADTKCLIHLWSCYPVIGLQSAGASMAFKCLTYAHTVLRGLVLSLREKEERRALTCLGWQLLRHKGLWGPRNTPASNPGQSSSIASIATGLFTESSRRNKWETIEEELEEAVSTSLHYQTPVHYKSNHKKPKSSQLKSHIKVIPLDLKGLSFPSKESFKLELRPHSKLPRAPIGKLESDTSNPREFIYYQSVPLWKVLITVRLYNCETGTLLFWY